MNIVTPPDPAKPQAGNFDWLWPAVSDESSARKAASQGATAAYICGGITLAVVVLGQFMPTLYGALGISAYALLDAAIFAGLGYGTQRCSRLAAVGGLSFYVFERVMSIRLTRGTTAVTILILGLMFVNGVRGAFGFHRARSAGPRGDTGSPQEPS